MMQVVNTVLLGETAPAPPTRRELASPLSAPALAPAVYIGTSGWSNLPWGKGSALPRSVRPPDRLAYLARSFSSVEVNSSFYRLPTPGAVERWAASTGPDFRFAVKLSRFITHVSRLRVDQEDLRAFLAAVEPFGPKRGPILVQLPPTIPKDLALLDAFLTQLHHAMGASPWRIAVELRSRTFLSDATYSLLDRHGAALVLADMPECPFTEPNDAPFLYIRRHGPTGDYSGGYSPDRIDEDADRARRALAAGRDVFIYFNNTIGEDAVLDALRLKDVLARSDVAIALASPG